jgi:hypothetical protein
VVAVVVHVPVVELLELGATEHLSLVEQNYH